MTSLKPQATSVAPEELNVEKVLDSNKPLDTSSSASHVQVMNSTESLVPSTLPESSTADVVMPAASTSSEWSLNMTFRRRRQYCVFGCTDLGAYMHRFPHPERRSELFKKWLSIVGNRLKQTDVMKIYKNSKVCDYHFSSNQKVASHRLIFLAVPTLYLNGVFESPGISVELEHNYSVPRMFALNSHEGDNSSKSLPLSNPHMVSSHKGEHLATVETTETTAVQPSSDAESATQTSLPEADRAKTLDDKDTADDVYDYDELFDDNIPSIKTVDPVMCDPPKDVPAAARVVHSGFKCNSCMGEIVGFRYRCVQCADYDLCPRCESSAAHAAHYVLRVPRPAPPAEVRGVLAAVRLALRLPPAADLGPEVKEEPDCVDLAEEVHEAPETAACRVDPLELDDVGQNEPKFPSVIETESAHGPQATADYPQHEVQTTAVYKKCGLKATEPPSKRLRTMILKRVPKPPGLNPAALRQHIKQHTARAGATPAARIELSRSTLRTLRSNPLKANELKLDTTRPVTIAPKPVAGQPEARRPILVSPRGSTAAAASGGAGGLPIVRLSRLPDRLTRAHLGR